MLLWYINITLLKLNLAFLYLFFSVSKGGRGRTRPNVRLLLGQNARLFESTPNLRCKLATGGHRRRMKKETWKIPRSPMVFVETWIWRVWKLYISFSLNFVIFCYLFEFAYFWVGWSLCSVHPGYLWLVVSGQRSKSWPDEIWISTPQARMVNRKGGILLDFRVGNPGWCNMISIWLLVLLALEHHPS